MANKVLGKINGRLKFLYRKSEFLTPSLRRLLCNAIIQPHFDFGSAAWYPNLTKKLKKKLVVAQNKCIRFCLKSGNRTHVGYREFEQMNWLPVEHRFQQSIATFSHNFFNGKCPDYMSDFFVPNSNGRNTRNSLHRLFKPASKTNGQKGLAFLGPTIWNDLSAEIKSTQNRNTFKHKLKSKFLDDLLKQDKSIFL